jgi:hypothetical protein
MRAPIRPRPTTPPITPPTIAGILVVEPPWLPAELEVGRWMDEADLLIAVAVLAVAGRDDSTPLIL